MNPEPMSFMDSDRYFEMRCSELDVFGSRYHRHIRHPSPEGLAEVSQIHLFHIFLVNCTALP